MRVLHLIPSISPRRGGPSQAVLAMTAVLRKSGVEARILTTNDDGPDQLALPLGQWQEQDGVPALVFPRWSPPQPAFRPLREFAVAPHLVSWLRGHLREWDLLHVHALFSFPSTAGMAVARHRRVPYLVRTIGQLQPWSLSQSRWRKRLFLALIERRNLDGAAALQATSPAEAVDFRRLGLTPPSLTLPLGVDLPVLDPGIRAQVAMRLPQLDPAAPRLLFLSRLHPKKQLEVLLEALARVRGKGLIPAPARAWQLLIAGDGEPAYVAQLQDQARLLGVADRCHWLGFVSGAWKRMLLQGCDWFVLPSAAENFGIAVAEALAASTPVILSPQVGIASAVAEAGAGLITEATPTALATALDTALTAPRQPFAAAARRLAEDRYGWPAVSGRLIEAYGRILDQPARTSSSESLLSDSRG